MSAVKVYPRNSGTGAGKGSESFYPFLYSQVVATAVSARCATVECPLV